VGDGFCIYQGLMLAGQDGDGSKNRDNRANYNFKIVGKESWVHQAGVLKTPFKCSLWTK
jgi:hypothetical protein